jgi:hypothetical protein
MNKPVRQADAVIQELWRIKDAAFEAAGQDPKRFIQLVRERSAMFREGLQPASSATLAKTAPTSQLS